MTIRILICTSLVFLCSWSRSFAETAAHPYEYMRGEYVVPCPDKESDSCIYHRLIVDNQSDDTLECHGHITYDGVNRDQVAKVDHPMVIEPKTRRAVLSDATNTEVKATAHSVDCLARPPLDNSKLTLNCKANLTKKPTGGIDYPIASRLAGQEGQVMLEFSLSDKEGPPTNIVVVGSSLWPVLDESAKKYVAQYAGTTDCKKGRFRMPLNFRLQ